jgi:glucuronoarabinoxylan endo-1,4-beta-xylanase
MSRHIVFCLLFLIGITVPVQTVTARVSGTVMNQAGKGIDSAIVTLVQHGIKDTTDTTGFYSLDPSKVSICRSLKPHSTTMTLHGGFINFSLLNPSPVTVEIFDLKGALLKKELLQNVSTGFYCFNIAENARTTKLLVVRASIGRDVLIFRFFPLNNVDDVVNSSVEGSIPFGGKLAKIKAIHETIKVIAKNYITKVIAISSYDTLVNITLDTVKGGAVTMQTAQTMQTMAGFGINNTWAPGAMTESEADALFDTTKGIGLSILRIGMKSDGGPMNSSSWSDITKAKARGVTTFIGTLWSPPGSYKTNNQEYHGGHLKPGNYEAWADTIAAFPAKVKSNTNIDLYAMSPQSEPDFACDTSAKCYDNFPTELFTDKEMVAFVKVVGPKLHALIPPVKVLAPEASEWIRTWSNNSAPGSPDPLRGQGYDYGHALYKDTEAWTQIDMIGVHQYYTQVAEPWPSDVLEMKPVWQTEMCGIKWWPEEGPSSDIDNGVAVAEWIHDAIVNGFASAWCWWWYKEYDTNDNGGLLLKDGTDTKRHYTLGNYSRFIRPGYTRVDITGDIPADILLSAYKGPDNKIVIVAINKGAASAEAPITIAGGTAPTSLVPWVTSESDNLKSKTAVVVSNGIFIAALAGKTVTTFVGK